MIFWPRPRTIVLANGPELETLKHSDIWVPRTVLDLDACGNSANRIQNWEFQASFWNCQQPAFQPALQPALQPEAVLTVDMLWSEEVI